jgi:hypothetical protein
MIDSADIQDITRDLIWGFIELMTRVGGYHSQDRGFLAIQVSFAYTSTANIAGTNVGIKVALTPKMAGSSLAKCPWPSIPYLVATANTLS